MPPPPIKDARSLSSRKTRRQNEPRNIDCQAGPKGRFFYCLESLSRKFSGEGFLAIKKMPLLAFLPIVLSIFLGWNERTLLSRRPPSCRRDSSSAQSLEVELLQFLNFRTHEQRFFFKRVHRTRIVRGSSAISGLMTRQFIAKGPGSRGSSVLGFYSALLRGGEGQKR